jgi:formylglycine-generating enzyme required for sulfatase activity
MPEPKRPLKVFLCHAHPDRDALHDLYLRLTKDSVDAWLDKEKLIGGQDWEFEIRRAVRESDVVVVCLSRQFAQKGFRQYEVRIALEEANLQPEGEIFIIPLRLEECNVPQGLRRWHWVDLFEEDGYERLMRALRARADRMGATLQARRSWLPKITSPRSIQRKPVETKKPEIPKKKSVEEKSEIPVDNGLPRIDEPLPPPEKFPESWESEWQPSFEPNTTREESISSAKLDLVPSTSAQETGRERTEKAERDGAKKFVKYPLARLKGMQDFMEFTKDPDWKPPLIDISLLKKLGIAKGKEVLVIQALLFLEVIDDAGIPTNEFDNLKRDYQATLKRRVQEKYGDLLSSIPLSKADQIRLVSYFGDPVDTAEYQAKLFVWFCQQSGIALPENDIEEKIALEKATREERKHEAAEKAAREKAKREAAEKAKREKAERRTAQITVLREVFTKFFNSLRLSIPTAKPFFRSVGIIGTIFVLIWVGLWVMPQFVSPTLTPKASSTAPLASTIALSSSPVFFTKTVEPSPTATKTGTPEPTALPNEITDAKGVQMVLVHAGTFIMGSDTFKDEKPPVEVTLDNFYMDVYEVTNALYRKCQEEKICTALGNSGSYSRSWFYYWEPRYENYPVIYVDWFQANKFCEWRGARLPLEAEWEKAARGNNRRSYPWGEDINSTFANYGSSIGDTTEVGKYEKGKSPYGMYDMAGNVWEWVSSLYKDYPYNANDGHEDLTASGLRVIRGGSWANQDIYLRSSARDGATPSGRNYNLGFRCAKDANP